MMNAPKKTAMPSAAPTGPVGAPQDPAAAGMAGMDPSGVAGTQFGQLHSQFSQMPPPDPATFLKLIWDHVLSPHQKELVMAMLKDPAVAAQGAQQPPAGQPAAGPSA